MNGPKVTNVARGCGRHVCLVFSGIEPLPLYLFVISLLQQYQAYMPFCRFLIKLRSTSVQSPHADQRNRRNNMMMSGYMHRRSECLVNQCCSVSVSRARKSAAFISQNTFCIYLKLCLGCGSAYIVLLFLFFLLTYSSHCSTGSWPRGRFDTVLNLGYTEAFLSPRPPLLPSAVLAH